MEITITEALAELKIINKRIATKRQFIQQNAVRHAIIVDPFEGESSTQRDRVTAELQAIGDLITRYLFIRQSISIANHATELTIGTVTRTVATWLVYRREQADGALLLMKQMQQAAVNMRNEIAQKLGQQPNPSGIAPDIKRWQVQVNFDEGALASAIEAADDVMGRLDGLLSLHNATVKIKV